MRKTPIALILLVVIVLLCSCGKNVTNTDIGYVEKTTTQETEAKSTKNEVTTTDVTQISSADKIKSNPGIVFVSAIDNNSGQTSDSVKQNRSQSRKVIEIINGNSFNSHSWDNINDYKIQVNGVDYYYDSKSGIITKDDTHAVKLSSEDKASLNSICNECETSTTAADSGTTITDTFIVKEVNGTDLTLARYDMDNGEYKEGLYSCNYGTIYGSYAMHFNAGDIVSVRYDKEIAETYPYQMNVREIELFSCG